MQAIEEWVIRGFWLLFVVMVGIGIYRSLKRKKRFREEKDEHIARVHTEADAAGIQVKEVSATDVSDLANPYGNTPEVAGDTVYEGTDQNIGWQLASSVRIGSRHNLGSKSSIRQVLKRNSRWHTQAVKMPADKYMLLMSTPGEFKKKQPQKGWWGKIVNTVADKTLDIYVNEYFGSGYASLVDVGTGTVVDVPELGNYFVLTNHNGLATAFFSQPTIRLFKDWKQKNQGFAQEGSVDQLGFLFTPTGVVAACQAAMHNAGEAKKLAAFAAAVSVQMQQAIRAVGY